MGFELKIVISQFQKPMSLSRIIRYSTQKNENNLFKSEWCIRDTTTCIELLKQKVQVSDYGKLQVGLSKNYKVSELFVCFFEQSKIKNIEELW